MKIYGSVGLIVTFTFAIFSTNLASNASPTIEEITCTEPQNEEYETKITTLPPVPVVTQSPEEIRCEEMIGYITEDNSWDGLNVSYDLQSILAKYGGPPGKVNATREDRESAPVESGSDDRPLPIAGDKYWLYNYTESDNATWRRSEHAVHRFRGSAKEFLEIRGNIIWTPEDFCGKARRADYFVDDRGFGFEVSREYCKFENEDFVCILPPVLHGVYPESVGLYASLVGGG